jgi:hypothetical protein
MGRSLAPTSGSFDRVATADGGRSLWRSRSRRPFRSADHVGGGLIGGGSRRRGADAEQHPQGGHRGRFSHQSMDRKSAHEISL